MIHKIYLQPDVRSAIRECMRFVSGGGWRSRASLDPDGRRDLLSMLRQATGGHYDYLTAMQAVAISIIDREAGSGWMASSAAPTSIILEWNDVDGRRSTEIYIVLAATNNYLERYL